MSELYLVRHGQTFFNMKDVVQGWCDSPLTQLGRTQADRAGAWFARKGIAFDHAYASTLGRARETISRLTSMPYEEVPGLREWSFGLMDGERRCLSPDKPWGDFYLQYGGESQAGVRKRMNNALTAIMSRPDHNCVLAVSHGSVCREFVDIWSEHSPCKLNGEPGNCSIMHFSFEDGVFRLEHVIEQDDMKE